MANLQLSTPDSIRAAADEYIERGALQPLDAMEQSRSVLVGEGSVLDLERSMGDSGRMATSSQIDLQDALDEEEQLTLAFLDQMERSAYEALWVRADAGNRLLEAAARALEGLLRQISMGCEAQSTSTATPPRLRSWRSRREGPALPPSGMDMLHLRDGIVSAASIFYESLGQRQRTTVRLQRKQVDVLQQKSEWMWRQGLTRPARRRTAAATIRVENMSAEWSPQRADTVARVFDGAERVHLAMPCCKGSDVPSEMLVTYTSEKQALRAMKGLHHNVLDGSPMRASRALHQPSLDEDAGVGGGRHMNGRWVGAGLVDDAALSPSRLERSIAHRTTAMAGVMYREKRAESMPSQQRGVPTTPQGKQVTVDPPPDAPYEPLY